MHAIHMQGTSSGGCQAGATTNAHANERYHYNAQTEVAPAPNAQGLQQGTQAAPVVPLASQQCGAPTPSLGHELANAPGQPHSLCSVITKHACPVLGQPAMMCRQDPHTHLLAHSWRYHSTCATCVSQHVCGLLWALPAQSQSGAYQKIPRFCTPPSPICTNFYEKTLTRFLYQKSLHLHHFVPETPRPIPPPPKNLPIGTNSYQKTPPLLLPKIPNLYQFLAKKNPHLHQFFEPKKSPVRFGGLR